MQLHEILPEGALSIERVRDQSSADRFLSRMNKKEAKISQPAVAKKIEEVKIRVAQLEDKNPDNPKIEEFQGALSRLEQWQKENPIVKVTNPARTAVGGPGSIFGTGRYGSQSSPF